MIDFSPDFNLPYLTMDLPGVGGRLRSSADDFAVEEIPLYEPAGEGQHLYVNLTKVGLTTKEVQRRLEELFGLKRGDVGFAGMKDKQARTTQTFSLAVGYPTPDLVESAAARIQDHLPVEVHWSRLHRNKLKIGHLLGNRFTITIAGLDCSVTEGLARCRNIAARLAESGLPNFFGPQRFGQNGGNVRQGIEAILGTRVVKDRWLRGFLFSAFQSYLCNRYLAARLGMGAFDRLLEGDVAKKHATGGMFDVLDLAAEQPRFEQKEISFTAPMFGAKMWDAKGESGALEAKVLAESPIAPEQLARARIEGTRRMGRILLDELEIHASGENITVRFSLPKGAFATVVLRELMKSEPGEMPEDEVEG